MMMNELKLSVYTALLTSVMLLSEAHAECDGTTRQEHRVGNFNFITNSLAEPAGTRKRYVSCVENLDAGSDLLVNWVIPGPYGQYVPASREVTTPRLSDDINERPVVGCLQYGQLSDTTKAQFLGSARDEELSTNDDCRYRPSDGSNEVGASGPLPPEGYADDVRVYFPSDWANAYDTMLEMTGKIGLMSDKGGYKSFFTYYVDRLEGREGGVVEDLAIRPYFPVAAKEYMSAFSASNLETTALAKEGNLQFAVQGEGSWRATEAYYQVIDKNEHVVATIPMPLLKLNRQ